MIDEAINKLAETSIMGLLLAISLATTYLIYKELKNERDNRLAELREYANTDRKFIIEIKQAIENILILLKGKNE